MGWRFFKRSYMPAWAWTDSVMGVSTQAGAHKTLVPALIDTLGDMDAGDIRVVCGGVIPAADHKSLKRKGVAALFGPGTPIPEAAAEVLSVLEADKSEAERQGAA